MRCLAKAHEHHSSEYDYKARASDIRRPCSEAHKHEGMALK